MNKKVKAIKAMEYKLALLESSSKFVFKAKSRLQKKDELRLVANDYLFLMYQVRVKVRSEYNKALGEL
jgi:hypothetical protein